MTYINTELLGLNGRPHPALCEITSTQDVKKLRIHLKFLTCDIQSQIYLDSGGLCSICNAESSLEHIMLQCSAAKDVKEQLLPTLLNTILEVQPNCGLLRNIPEDRILTQFLLDCTSINLPEIFRVPSHNPAIANLFRVSRDWCYAITTERSRQLRHD